MINDKKELLQLLQNTYGFQNWEIRPIAKSGSINEVAQTPKRVFYGRLLYTGQVHENPILYPTESLINGAGTFSSLVGVDVTYNNAVDLNGALTMDEVTWDGVSSGPYFNADVVTNDVEASLIYGFICRINGNQQIKRVQIWDSNLGDNRQTQTMTITKNSASQDFDDVKVESLGSDFYSIQMRYNNVIGNSCNAVIVVHESTDIVDIGQRFLYAGTEFKNLRSEIPVTQRLSTKTLVDGNFLPLDSQFILAETLKDLTGVARFIGYECIAQ